jgi:hypothetical protein
MVLAGFGILAARKAVGGRSVACETVNGKALFTVYKISLWPGRL